jgi:hypothetical protein
MIEAVAHPQRSMVREAVAYLLVVTAAEVVTMFFHPLWGVIGHAAIMATAIVRSARTDDSSQRQLVLSLALVPLIRVIDLSLSISLIPIPTIGRFPIIYTPLLVASVVVVRALGYRLSEVGLNFKSLPAQLGIASSGLLFGWWGIVYVSVLFAILHMGFHSVLDVLFVFGVAMFFGWAVKKAGSLLGMTLAHGLTNIMLFLIFPFFY